MSDNFNSSNSIAKLSNSNESGAYFETLDDVVSIDDLGLPYDHMYASSNGIEAGDTNNQTTDSEIKFLKEWLIIHLDLIQQQNDEILSKEKTIYVLKQENEKLKERLHYMESNIKQNNKVINNHKIEEEEFSVTTKQEMTQDLGSIDDDGQKLGETAENINSILRFDDNEEKHLLNCTITNNIHKVNVKEVVNNKLLEPYTNDIESTSKYEGSYTIHNSTENDPMKNLKMSIRRKRLCSTSSAFSNNDSDEKRNRRARKRRKKSINSDNILTTNDQYVTYTGESNLCINPLDLGNDLPANSCTTNLEVPRWRLKAYTSCYTMEGTENLEDEVFLKRHSRLENDERRRKRWDVQRIREQRHIEKLKQRQEKIGNRNEESDPIESLWPSLDDIKYIEVTDSFPIAAFGYPIPRFHSSDFSLSWMNNPNTNITKKGAGKRNRSKRRSSTKR